MLRSTPITTQVTKPTSDRRGAVAVEFALVAVPFFLVLFFVIELSLALFRQEALDSALHLAARRLQTGNAQSVANGADFVIKHLCPAASGLLDCNNMLFKVQRITFAPGQDFYDVTSAATLDLSTFGSATFCNAGPAEFLLLSAVYLAPSVLGGLLPNVLSTQYNGATVHVTLSQLASYSENYPKAAATKSAAAGC